MLIGIIHWWRECIKHGLNDTTLPCNAQIKIKSNHSMLSNMSHQVIGDRSFMWVKSICQLAPPSYATCANSLAVLSPQHLLQLPCPRSSAPHSLSHILKLHCKGD